MNSASVTAIDGSKKPAGLAARPPPSPSRPRLASRGRSVAPPALRPGLLVADLGVHYAGSNSAKGGRTRCRDTRLNSCCLYVRQYAIRCAVCLKYVQHAIRCATEYIEQGIMGRLHHHLYCTLRNTHRSPRMMAPYSQAGQAAPPRVHDEAERPRENSDLPAGRGTTQHTQIGTINGKAAEDGPGAAPQSSTVPLCRVWYAMCIALLGPCREKTKKKLAAFATRTRRSRARKAGLCDLDPN